ncbi:hypothetical protein L2E82_01862 [Cichorium intybus]|uniref:Uncharacterized protein n=1 Tax=Cichorium intybus TaxID=13427 RepID=A0ACB9H032_CICIN|nr:hypothetical protein L2E82_01862 [Cichorium intybus]
MTFAPDMVEKAVEVVYIEKLAKDLDNSSPLAIMDKAMEKYGSKKKNYLDFTSTDSSTTTWKQGLDLVLAMNSCIFFNSTQQPMDIEFVILQHIKVLVEMSKPMEFLQRVKTCSIGLANGFSIKMPNLRRYIASSI